MRGNCSSIVAMHLAMRHKLSSFSKDHELQSLLSVKPETPTPTVLIMIQRLRCLVLRRFCLLVWRWSNSPTSLHKHLPQFIVNVLPSSLPLFNLAQALPQFCEFLLDALLLCCCANALDTVSIAFPKSAVVFVGRWGCGIRRET